jgi:hypothetical protein
MLNERTTMKYILICPTGKIRQFYVAAMADLYKDIYGGTIVTEEVLTVAVEQQAT